MTTVEELEDSVEEVEEYDFEYAESVDGSYLGELWGDILLVAEHDPADWRKNGYLDHGTDFLNEAYAAALIDEDGEEIVDNDEYIRILQTGIFGLLRQLDLCVAALTGAVTTTPAVKEKIGVIPFDESLCRRMLAYALTGLEPTAAAQQKMWAENDYTKCLFVFDYLPPELQQRAAMWLEKYAASMFSTEHSESNAPLAGTLT